MAVVVCHREMEACPPLFPGHRTLFVEKARAEAEYKARGDPAAQVCALIVFLLEVQLLLPSTPEEREVCWDRLSWK